MTHVNQRLFFNALGFTAVILQGSTGRPGDAQRAAKFAKLIEEFCRLNIPDTFPEASSSPASAGKSDARAE